MLNTIYVIQEHVRKVVLGGDTIRNDSYDIGFATNEDSARDIVSKKDKEAFKKNDCYKSKTYSYRTLPRLDK